ncbi:MAG: substrate-binding domain-containing protein [Clostridia bacterium]|nr:substrate-binding domain-containing protein [Clostridia bacterium]
MSKKYVTRLATVIRTISAGFSKRLRESLRLNSRIGLRNKTVCTFLTVVLFSASLSGCSENNPSIEKGVSVGNTKKIKIGFSMGTLQEERWQRDRDIFVAKANELGAEVIVQNANNSSDDQYSQVKYLLEQDIDILAVVPHDAISASSIVQLAKKEGVKVISYDRLVKNAGVDVYISFDNVKVGELMAEYTIEKVPKGNYVIINGAKTDNNTSLFNKGYKKILDPYVEKGDIDIVSEIWAEDWVPEEAYKCIEQTLKKGERIDAVIAGNDTLAASAIQALAERRLAGKVAVAGHDADLAGCQRVVEGTQHMTIYKPIDIIAQSAAVIAVQLAKGQDILCNSKINDGKYDIPYYMIKPIAVTRENIVETVIQDGFHKLEDVFRNVPKSQWPKEQWDREIYGEENAVDKQ